MSPPRTGRSDVQDRNGSPVGDAQCVRTCTLLASSPLGFVNYRMRAGTHSLLYSVCIYTSLRDIVSRAQCGRLSRDGVPTRAMRGKRTQVTRWRVGRAICARRLEVSVGLCNKCTAPWIKFNTRMTALVLRGCDASISEN